MNLPLHWKRQIPNGLTMSRLVLTPGLLLWLWVDDARGFLLYGLALTLTDVLDGVLARRWKVMTDRGRDLDGKADMVFVTTFYGGAVWFLWNEIAAAWPIVLLPILLFALLQPLGYLLNGGHQGFGRRCFTQVVQQHHTAPECANRIGQAFAHDVFRSS